jgi:antitoxin component of MazEF toxin-antitoxin module
MHGVVKKWGGSLAIRLDMESSRKAGLKEGMEVEFDLRPAPLDFASLPTVQDVRDAAKRHDELLHARD